MRKRIFWSGKLGAESRVGFGCLVRCSDWMVEVVLDVGIIRGGGMI